jgi:hypothetical protein
VNDAAAVVVGNYSIFSDVNDILFLLLLWLLLMLIMCY